MDDGVPEDLEYGLRSYGCKLIQQAGILLKQFVSYSNIQNALLDMLSNCAGSK